jgi:ATP-dependent Lhr-like helicase
MSTDSQETSWTFSPPVWAWFEQTFERPTPPQAQGWPAIQRGEHTLILAPTGLGKTLAAFLWGIDSLYRELTALPEGKTPPLGVRIVYISPLKALNNDIRRNLRTPLAGIRRVAHDMNFPFPEIRVAVRSGDTPTRERQAMVRQPPHILITTPESFYLLLTSPKAREMFRRVHTVIVDEIHTLAGNKRGVHLSLSLERLAHLAEGQVQRIGLSATIQPLDEVARFLGGLTPPPEGTDQETAPQEDPSPSTVYSLPSTFTPVTIVNAHAPKTLDLRVVTPIDDFLHLPGDSLWPSLIPHLLQLIRRHRTTLIFCNNRHLAERTASRLNEQLAAEAEGKTTALIENGVATGLGMMASGNGSHPVVIRAHHGSMSREARLEMERDLKAGKLQALVATSSLELGIDIGSIDLVIQLQSPKSVAQGLQRVGRSGHLVGETSKGRLFPTHREDVMEAAAVSGGMLRGEVEPTYTPRNPLDVLAQQIVAMISVESWDVEALYQLVRRAYAYQDLSWSVFQSVLEMLAGRYPSQAHRELRPRLAWDRVNNKLNALPGSRMLALTNGGTIADRGTFGAYLAEGRSKLGELDEEFIYETRIGDTFLLGSQVWRVIDITDDRIMVREAPGATPRIPFWRGEYAWRPYELGRRIGQFRRTVAERIMTLGENWNSFREIEDRRETEEIQALVNWLGEDYALDRRSAWQVLDYVVGQLDSYGAISSDRTIIVEVFSDDLGTPQMVVHSPFGGRVNGPWGLALAGVLRERTGVPVEVQSNDDGILFRFVETDTAFPLDLVPQLSPAEARERLLRELPDSAVFGAQFRQNAARSLLLPGSRPGKRTPFWLQRLKAKDLLQVVRQFDDFPILIETYRDCLEDVMDLPNLETVLKEIQTGQIDVQVVESLAPSPVALGLLRRFQDIYLYEWDTPKAERQLRQLTLNRDLLQDVLKAVNLGDLFKPEAITAVTGQLQHTSIHARARTTEELAVILEQMGDLSTAEIVARTTGDPAPWLQTLHQQGRIRQLSIPTAYGSEVRWVSSHQSTKYEEAFGLIEGAADPEAAREAILTRFLGHAGPVTLETIRARYDFPSDWLAKALDRRIEVGEIAYGRFTPGAEAPQQYLERRNLEQIHRRTLSLLRREVRPVPRAVYADFLARWQHLYPEGRLGGEGAIVELLQQLRALPVVGPVWERAILPLRLATYRRADLDALCQRGEVVWIGSGGSDPRRIRVRFIFRGEGRLYLEPAPEELDFLSADVAQVYQLLKSEGALFMADLQAVLDQPEAKLQAILFELALNGLVTNDNLETLRRIWRGEGAKQPHPQIQSSLAAQLAERRGQTSGAGPGLRRPSRSAYQAARRRVTERLQQTFGPGPTEAASSPGRWSLVHRLGVLGKQVTAEEQAARQARQLLQRWGVVTRETLAVEEGAWNWGVLYPQLSLMEMRGEVRRGYFVSDLPGLQFALPEVVEVLRERRQGEEAEEAPLIVLNACDPANLYGPALEDGPLTAGGEPLTFARLPSTWLVQQGGHPILLAEGTGATITTVQGYTGELTRRALQAWGDHLAHYEHRLTVQTWNGNPILESDGQPLLESLGFRRDYPGMTWERRW